jgi:hypothetical protein
MADPVFFAVILDDSQQDINDVRSFLIGKMSSGNGAFDRWPPSIQQRADIIDEFLTHVRDLPKSRLNASAVESVTGSGNSSVNWYGFRAVLCMTNNLRSRRRDGVHTARTAKDRHSVRQAMTSCGVCLLS